MNALSDLAAEVKFRERMRGYDYEEVDSYVKTVSRVAAQARDRIAELEHRLAQSESQDGSDEGVAEIRETLLRTLVLAQRTADSAVSEARSEARSITDSAKERAAKTVSEAETAANERLRSAEERAARMLAESEESGRLIISEAKRTAATELAAEREQAQAELRALEATRGEMESVVAEIEARLDSERDTLRSLAVSFQSFVEKFEPVTGIGVAADGPEAGRSAAAPDVDSAVIESAVIEAAGDAGSAGETASSRLVRSVAAIEAAGDAGSAGGHSVAEDRPDPPAAAGDGRAEEAGAPACAAADPGPPGGSATGFVPDGESAAREPGDAPEDVPAPEDAAAPYAAGAGAGSVPAVERDEAAGHGLPDERGVPGSDGASPDAVRLQSVSGGNGAARRERDGARRGDEAAPAGPATVPFGVDSPELFDVDAEEDDEFIEQLRQVVSSDAALPGRDAAMAAFFDHDAGSKA